eukprot:scaffold9512_cov181-Amphora_coffeaeformis.AAC.3
MRGGQRPRPPKITPEQRHPQRTLQHRVHPLVGSFNNPQRNPTITNNRTIYPIFCFTMRLTAVLRQAEKKSHKSLALSVYFQHPDLTGKRHEILSRASAFLWGIDPKPEPIKEGPYSHLDKAEQRRKEREFKQFKSYTPALGPGSLSDMGWLEYIPKEARPQVHVVASSHVISPFLWKEYYPQDWLSVVRQEHCSYALEVYDSPAHAEQEPLLKLALHPTPYHHPEGRDIALIHLKDEESALPLLKSVGVDILYTREKEKLFQKGETMYFDGYAVEEPGSLQEEPAGTPAEDESDLSDDEDEENEDLRIFQPYHVEGQLSFHTDDRFFAMTPKPLPEGLCGAPVLDREGDLCGVVEGIVPLHHADKRLAGSAAFIPSFQLETFIDFSERQMAQDIMPPDLFQMVVNAKQTNSFSGGPFKLDDAGNAQKATWDEMNQAMIDKLKQNYTPQEVESFLSMIRDEGGEVLRIMDEEGGDMDDIIARVRAKTLEMRDKIHEEFRQSQEEGKKKAG